MDEHRFDSLARLLGQAADRRQGLKAALAAVFGGGAAVAALEADAKGKGKARAEDQGGEDDVDDEKHRKICSKRKPCPSGWSCVKGKKVKHGHKRRKKRTCVCSTGITCGVACCAAGQACVNGACSDSPDPGVCIAKGEACKGVGRPCCAGLKCASGQGGDADIACYVSKRGACASTADCAYGTTCQDGTCMGPVPAGDPCETGDICIQGACGPYQSGNPAGTFCLIATGNGGCTADHQCVGQYCHGGVCRIREADTTEACGQGGTVCANPLDTCTTYQSGTPGGKFCLRAANDPCDTDAECRAGACGSDSRCKAWTGEQCGINAGGITCANPLDSCVGYDSGTPTGFHCLRQLGESCTGGADCQSGNCVNDVCSAPVATGAECVRGQSTCVDPKASCTTYQPDARNVTVDATTRCLLPDNTSPDGTAVASGCTANGQCASGQCGRLSATDTSGYCVPLTCLVCKPYASGTACKYGTVQAAVGAGGEITSPTLPLHGPNNQIDIPVYAGTYEENVTFQDANWFVHPCYGRPVLSAASGTIVTVSAAAAPEKFVTFDKVTFTGTPTSAVFAQGSCASNCTVATSPAWVNLELTNVEGLFASGTPRYLVVNPYVKLTATDSHFRNSAIYSNTENTSDTLPNEITLVRTIQEGGDNQLTGIAIAGKGANLTLEDSTVSGWKNTAAPGGGVGFFSSNLTHSSSLTITGSSTVTLNESTQSSGKGSGVYLGYAGIPVTITPGSKSIFDVATANPNATDATAIKNCYNANADQACPTTAGGFTSA